jgi:peptidoglycan/xylan/chitin deacetylase (PgdA/CDA1 family)
MWRSPPRFVIHPSPQMGNHRVTRAPRSRVAFRTSSLVVTLALGWLVAAVASVPATGRTVAVTIDDLPFVPASIANAELARRTAQLLAALRSAHVRATGFVNEDKLNVPGDPQGALDERRVRLLAEWLDSGMDLGNHTFGHVSLDDLGPTAYGDAILRGERTLRKLLAARGRTPKYFRHPFLRTGRSLAVKKQVSCFLSAHGYRIAPVTVDGSDWIFARAYHDALTRNDRGLVRRLGDEYVPYMERKLDYWERQSRALLGREPAQVLLIHASELNADRFGDLAAMMSRRGYRFVTLDQALADPAYRERDSFFGNAGISWLHRWVLARGQRPLAGEPVTPQWVMKAAGVVTE